MSISELYQSGTQKNNVAHFAAIANIAIIDGEINEEERELLAKFAYKLNITESQFDAVVQNPAKYPINPPSDKQERLQYLYDLFRMIFADHIIDKDETQLVHKYAIGLGCTSEYADKLIQKSIKIFGGNIDFEDYEFLVNRK